MGVSHYDVTPESEESQETHHILPKNVEDHMHCILRKEVNFSLFLIIAAHQMLHAVMLSLIHI